MEIGAKATVSCSFGTNCIFIPGLCANRDNNRGPAIEMGEAIESGDQASS